MGNPVLRHPSVRKLAFFPKKQQIGNFCLANSSFWQVWIFPTLAQKNGRLCLISTLRKIIEKWRVFAQRSFTHSYEKWKSSIWKLKMKRLMVTYHLMKVVDLFLYYREEKKTLKCVWWHQSVFSTQRSKLLEKVSCPVKKCPLQFFENACR